MCLLTDWDASGGAVVWSTDGRCPFGTAHTCRAIGSVRSDHGLYIEQRGLVRGVPVGVQSRGLERGTQPCDGRWFVMWPGVFVVQVQRAVQASRPAQAGGPDMDAPPPPPPPPADAEPSEYSATVAIDRTSFSRSPPNDVGHGRDNGSHGGGIHAEAAGRRWFSMFARRTASMRTSSSEGVLLTSSAPVLGSMHADEPAAGALIGMSSDVAQRRVGTQAVFNPSAHVNEDDAQFLRGTPALSAGSVEVPLEEIREAAQPSGSPGLARSSELADISGSGTQSSLSLPIDKRQVLPSTQKRL